MTALGCWPKTGRPVDRIWCCFACNSAKSASSCGVFSGFCSMFAIFCAKILYCCKNSVSVLQSQFSAYLLHLLTQFNRLYFLYHVLAIRSLMKSGIWG